MRHNKLSAFAVASAMIVAASTATSQSWNATVSPSCTAQASTAETAVSLKSEGGRVSLVFRNEGWDYQASALAVAFAIDSAAWDAPTATVEGNALTVRLPEGAAGIEIIQHLRGGNTLRLMTPENTVIQTHTLSGSARAIATMAECLE